MTARTRRRRGDLLGGALVMLPAILALAVLPGCAPPPASRKPPSDVAPAAVADASRTAEATPRPGAVSTAASATAASATPRPAPRPSAVPVFHGDEDSRRVALTFDLCETPDSPTGFDRKIVETLQERHVKATFFMGGHWAETHRDEARALGAVVYFEIGNHAYAHRHPTRISSSAFRQELVRAQEAISRFAGRTPTLFRFPYGEYDRARLRQVADARLTPVQWSVVSGDPDRGVSAKAIVAEVRRSARGGSIVIMHANGRGWHTAEALPRVIDALRANGLEPVTVSELLAP